jgi:hypothetical protein
MHLPEIAFPISTLLNPGDFVLYWLFDQNLSLTFAYSVIELTINERRLWVNTRRSVYHQASGWLRPEAAVYFPDDPPKKSEIIDSMPPVIPRFSSSRSTLITASSMLSFFSLGSTSQPVFLEVSCFFSCVTGKRSFLRRLSECGDATFDERLSGRAPIAPLGRSSHLLHMTEPSPASAPHLMQFGTILSHHSRTDESNPMTALGHYQPLSVSPAQRLLSARSSRSSWNQIG